MSEAVKTRHTSKKVARSAIVPIMVGENYRVKLSALNAEKVKKYAEKLRMTTDDYVTSEEVFKDLYDKYGRANVLLKGYRLKLGLTQTQLAGKIGARQSDIANIERGKRSIGKDWAKRFAGVFDVDYRIFL